MNPFALLLQSVVGLSSAMVLFLAAAGLSIIFGVVGLINLAHGSFYMLGAFLCYSLTLWFANTLGRFWLALLLGPLVVALVGGLIEFFILRRVYRLEHIYQLLVTFGLIMIIGESVRIIWGKAERAVATPDILAGSLSLAGGYFPLYRLFLIAVGPLIAVGLWFLINKTRLGHTIRAAALDPEMANALGLDVPLLFTGVFIFGSWLAGLGGVLAAPLAAIWSGMDTIVCIECFLIVVIGGAGSIGGALVAAILVGLTDAFGIVFLPRFAMLFIYALMIVVLLFRPWGLLGKPMIR